MPVFEDKMRIGLGKMSPLQLLYRLGIRGKSVREIAHRLAQGESISAQQVAQRIGHALDFLARENFSKLDLETRSRIATILEQRQVERAASARPGSNPNEIANRSDPLIALAANNLFSSHDLDYLASQKGFPPQAVEDYVKMLAKELPPELIRQIFPEGYLFKDYFFWIDAPFKNAYVYKFKDEYYFHFPGGEGGGGFMLKSRDYGRLLLKAMNAMAAYHLGKAAVALSRLQVVPSRNCNDRCQFCPFILDNNHVSALTNEQADAIIALLNDNPGIDSLLF